MTALSIRALSKAFGGVHAVRDVSFDIKPGEFLAMIGPNGAGKSTCFNMINGQLKPDSGEIRLGDDNIGGCIRATSGGSASGAPSRSPPRSAP